jgi:hypothetical protein
MLSSLAKAFHRKMENLRLASVKVFKTSPDETIVKIAVKASNDTSS